MALANADRDLVVQTLFDIVGQDYILAARILVKLEARFPSVAWRSRFSALLDARPEYLDGLSIPWWKAEVVRIADTLV